MANKGLTKEEILAEFKIDDSEYKSAVSQLPEGKRKDLHYLLINNAKKKLIKTVKLNVRKLKKLQVTW